MTLLYHSQIYLFNLKYLISNWMLLSVNKEESIGQASIRWNSHRHEHFLHMLQAHDGQKCSRKQIIRREQRFQITQELLHWPTANTEFAKKSHLKLQFKLLTQSFLY